MGLTPRLFVTNKLEFDFDPSSPMPARWLQLMDEIWVDDPDSPKLLQEFFGYSPSGMRKLIERSKRRLKGYPVKGPTIRFFQSSPGDEIKFRSEWLDESIDACTRDPEKAPLSTIVAKPMPKKENRAGAIMRALSNSGFAHELLAV